MRVCRCESSQAPQGTRDPGNNPVAWCGSPATGPGDYPIVTGSEPRSRVGTIQRAWGRADTRGCRTELRGHACLDQIANGCGVYSTHAYAGRASHLKNRTATAIATAKTPRSTSKSIQVEPMPRPRIMGSRNASIK